MFPTGKFSSPSGCICTSCRWNWRSIESKQKTCRLNASQLAGEMTSTSPDPGIGIDITGQRVILLRWIPISMPVH